MPARLVQEVEKTKRRARHERAPSASPSGRERAVMDRLKRDLERADVAIVLSTAKLNKPLELHMRDTLDWDLWPGFAGARPVAFGGGM